LAIANRVAPDGTLHGATARGMLTGNRGVIHDPATRNASGKRWTTQAWIACRLDWKGERRDVWGANGRNGRPGWSELFFLDEVTALAAGHRPCFHCRRSDALHFRAAAGGLSAPQCDAILHRERWLSGKREPALLTCEKVASLPDGAMVKAGSRFFAVKAGAALPWDFGGYGNPVPLESLPAGVCVVTPPIALAAIAGGYAPAWHPSASPGQQREGSHGIDQGKIAD
jgi:hypothetical protein